MDAERVQKIQERLDEIVEHLIDVKVDISALQRDVEANKDSLVEHMRRTNLLEEEMQRQEVQLLEAMKPIEWAKMTGKLLAWIIPIIGAVVGAWWSMKK